VTRGLADLPAGERDAAAGGVPGDGPPDVDVLLSAVAAARAARDWPAMLAAARRFAAACPNHPAALRHEAAALAESGDLAAAEALLQSGVKRFPGNPWVHFDQAALAERRGDAQLASQRWAAASRLFPDHAPILQRAGKALLRAGRLADANRLLAGAETRFPGDLGVLNVWAETAASRRALDEAAARYALLRERFPNDRSGYAGLSDILLRKAEYNAADEAARAGLARFPNSLELLVTYARIATTRLALPNAERRWRAALDRFPLNPACIAGLAQTLHLQDRHEESEAVLRAGVEALPHSDYMHECYARSAMLAADWPEAARRWRTHVSRYPRSGVGFHLLGVCLTRSGDARAGEAALAEGMGRMPGYLDLAFEHAWHALARDDYAEAERRWRALEARVPHRLEIMAGKLHTRLATELGRSALNARVDLPPEDLLARFESLGENCEFGLLQRQYGLEPISLFRWAAISVAGLIHGLEEGFNDVGNPENVSLIVHAADVEYYVREKAYRFGMHTQVPPASVEEDKFFKQQCRRLHFLGRKLAEDLTSGEKIFVHLRHNPIAQHEILQLHRCMRRYGKPWLLYVELANDLNPPGTVRMADDGLILGYIARFGNATRRIWDIDTACWLDVCRQALALRDIAARCPQPHGG
jgi:predicted Zn-dependent protease